MPEIPAPAASRRLVLASRLEELARVFPWVEALACAHALPPETCFAINLCLEEALSNAIRHGYAGDAGQTLTVEFALNSGQVVFVVEDAAPPFDPLTRAEPAAAPTLDELIPGGQGIHLIR
ncbi:MAG: ATP-binding protein, partial [Terracidiphilus sp.]